MINLKIYNFKVYKNNKFLYLDQHNKNKNNRFYQFMCFMRIDKIMQIMFYNMHNLC